jgi:hypothetical protein
MVGPERLSVWAVAVVGLPLLLLRLATVGQVASQAVVVVVAATALAF